jgi:hypothetical protein
VCEGAAVPPDQASEQPPERAAVPARSLYRVRRAYFARALGRSAIVAAALMLIVTGALALSAPAWLTALLVVLATVALVITAIVAVSLVMPPTLLQLDEQGYRVGKRYTSGPRQAGWIEVQNAASQEGPDGWVLVLQLHDGRHAAVPLALADARAVAMERDVRARLDAAHGYRPLDGPPSPD